MPQTESHISLYQLVDALSDAVDLVSPTLKGHHTRVGVLGAALAEAVGMPATDVARIAVAGLIHDAGALTLTDRLQLAKFDFDSGAKEDDHEYMGYTLFRKCPYLSEVAQLVRFHHLRWDRRYDLDLPDDIALRANLLFLADRIDTLLVLRPMDTPVLAFVDEVVEKVSSQAGRMFAPELVDTFKGLSTRASFWLDVVTPRRSVCLERYIASFDRKLDHNEVLAISKMFSAVIDFRSRFTATHSAGVAASAEYIAAIVGFTPDEVLEMHLAGLLHDIGKLAVSSEILEKPAALTREEFAVIRSHTYHSYRIIERIDGFERINQWASFHHERLNGTGYPFNLGTDQLPLGSRIMAVADVLTAITEDRPYRAGMPLEKAQEILNNMAGSGALDPEVVSVVAERFGSINVRRASAQQVALDQFEGFAEQTQAFSDG